MPGTINTSVKPVLFKQKEFGMELTLKAGADLAQGQEVRISADNTVNTRSGTQFPIGVVSTAGKSGEDAVVLANFSAVMSGVAKGATIAAGAFLKQNGTINANGTPEYVAAASGDYSCAIAIVGGAVDAVITVGLLESVQKI